MAELKRYHVVCKGQVQGVGFRWRARMAAESLGVTGWVKNEWDGSVTMEVQGTDQAISRMLSQIDAGSFIRIEDIERTPVKVIPDERRFRVTGYY